MTGRRSPGSSATWPRHPRLPRLKRFPRPALFATVAAVILIAGRFAPRLAGWDDSFYAAQLSSLVEDGDVDLRNDLEATDLEAGELRRALSTVDRTGLVLNPFPIGPALLWSPGYLLGAVAGGERWNGAQRALLHLQSALLTLLLVWGLERLARRCGLEGRAATVVTAGLWLATPLFYYSIRGYKMSHLLSAVAGLALISTVLELERRPSRAAALAAGAALGVVGLVRWQDLIAGCLLVAPWLAWRRERLAWRDRIVWSAAVGAAALAILSLQSHAWWRASGEWVHVVHGAGFWRAPELRRFLFSGVSGLFTWSPLFALGLAGLLLPWRLRLDRSWRWAALAACGLQILVNASVDDWWGGASYGARRMSAVVPLLALGVANAVTRWRRAGLAAITVCIVWGFFTFGLYTRQVQDLSLVFRGQPSDAPGVERELYLVRDPAEARRRAARFPISLDLPNYVPIDKTAGRVATVTLLLAALATLWKTLAGPEARRRMLLRIAAAAVVALVVAAHLRLAGAL